MFREVQEGKNEWKSQLIYQRILSAALIETNIVCAWPELKSTSHYFDNATDKYKLYKWLIWFSLIYGIWNIIGHLMLNPALKCISNFWFDTHS